jgi:hypothetical protein
VVANFVKVFLEFFMVAKQDITLVDSKDVRSSGEERLQEKALAGVIPRLFRRVRPDERVAICLIWDYVEPKEE